MGGGATPLPPGMGGGLGAAFDDAAAVDPYDFAIADATIPPSFMPWSFIRVKTDAAAYHEAHARKVMRQRCKPKLPPPPPSNA